MRIQYSGFSDNEAKPSIELRVFPESQLLPVLCFLETALGVNVSLHRIDDDSVRGRAEGKRIRVLSIYPWLASPAGDIEEGVSYDRLQGILDGLNYAHNVDHF